MASMNSIPRELVQMIAYAGLGSDDLLSFRQTCKDINALAKDAHLDSIYGNQRVFLLEASLQRLLKISQHSSGVNLRVRRLAINITEPILNENPMGPGPYPELSDEDNERFRSIWADLTEYDDSVLAEEEQQECLSLLKRALTNLPNISIIDLELHLDYSYPPFDEGLTLSQMRVLFPPAGFTAERPASAELLKVIYENIKMDLNWFYSPEDIWNDLLFLIKDVGLSKVKSLSTSSSDLTDQISIEAFHRPGRSLVGLHTALPALHTLRLQINFRNWQFDDDDILATESVQWLEQIGPRLQNLDLRNHSRSRIYSRLLIRMPTKVGLPYLKTLHLECLRLLLDNFMVFLGLSRAGLSTLVLNCCLLIEEGEESEGICERDLTAYQSDAFFSRYSNKVFRLLRFADSELHKIQSILIDIGITGFDDPINTLEVNGSMYELSKKSRTLVTYYASGIFPMPGETRKTSGLRYSHTISEI